MSTMQTNGFPPVLDKIQLSPTAAPVNMHTADPRQDSTDRTNVLLTANHAMYHNRWNAGFHNHIVHHLLAIWALGGSPEEIQEMWDYNEPYQAPIEKRDSTTAPEDLNLHDSTSFDQCLGKDECYVDFLRFFKDEIAAKSVSRVVREYVLKGDDRANDIFSRMYTDLVHPMIHLGCGLEFNQPSIVAEALAAACVHDNWPKQFLMPAEDYVQSNPEKVPSSSLLHIMNSLREDPEIGPAVHGSSVFNKIPDALLKRVSGEQLAPYLGQYKVRPTPHDLQAKMNEMMHTCAFVMGAAQRPGKTERIDFAFLHSVTLSCYYPAILAQGWMTDGEKARLLEAKARVDAVMYAGCGSPELFPWRITTYMPRHPKDGWPELFHRSIIYRDEGHAVKLIRALYAVEQLGAEEAAGLPIEKQDYFKIAHLSMDSLEAAVQPGGSLMPKDVEQMLNDKVGHGGEMVTANQKRWVFYGGLPTAWKFVPDLAN